MNRNEGLLLMLVVLIVAVVVFAIFGVALHHLADRVQFQVPPQ